LYLHDVGNRSPTRVGGGARVVCHGLRTSQSRGEVERGEDFSCEAETSRVRQRLVRGGDFSCEAETCRADSSGR
jgi:hypothetical protein